MTRNKATQLSLCKRAELNSAYFVLSDIGITKETVYGINDSKNIKDIFFDLVVFTPTNQSHLGVKFDEYTKLNNNTTDAFLKSLFSGLGIVEDNIFLFRTYKTKTRNLNNLDKDITNSTKPMLALRCDNGVKDSFFMALRNSIAHGNIIYDGKYYVLYSVSDDKKEYDTPVSFLLRIDKLTKLQNIKKTLEKYK